MSIKRIKVKTNLQNLISIQEILCSSLMEEIRILKPIINIHLIKVNIYKIKSTYRKFNLIPKIMIHNGNLNLTHVFLKLIQKLIKTKTIKISQNLINLLIISTCQKTITMD